MVTGALLGAALLKGWGGGPQAYWLLFLLSSAARAAALLLLLQVRDRRADATRRRGTAMPLGSADGAPPHLALAAAADSSPPFSPQSAAAASLSDAA
jgi:hypothetical protein